MGSKKRSAWAKQKAEFSASLGSFGSFDDAFSRERQRHSASIEAKAEARKRKACTSKNRYSSREEAQENLAWCQENGRTGLSIYRCPYCDGWHLTSHPWDE